MSFITPVRANVTNEETQFRAAVSEATMQKVGSSINFINTYQEEHKSWYLNGSYSTLTVPFAAIDGIFVLDRNVELVSCSMFVRLAGSVGTTELDIKYATAPGGAWTSIFSTTPKIGYLAGNFAWCNTGSSFANTTAPVISVTNLAAGYALRADLIAYQGGGPRGTGINLNFRPR